MNNRLEQFIRDNRDEFDTDEPGKKVWEDIQSRMGQPGSTEDSFAKTTRFRPVRWIVAAAILFILAGAGWYFTQGSTRISTPAAESPIAANGPATDTPTGKPGEDKTGNPAASTTSGGTTQPAAGAETPGSEKSGVPDKGSLAAAASKDAANPKAPGLTDEEATIHEEMYHYARLVELKHKELKTIETDEPLLYKQFAADVHNLDSVYQTLQQQLPKNPNREQLLEAMLQNLQLQMGLLNHQLDIIKQINHSKKTAYEKAYKTA